jgi:hypothetical protein
VTFHASKIICIGVPPIFHSLSYLWYPDGARIDNSRISSVNAVVRTKCANYVDTSNFIIDNSDGIHPSAKGYDV